MLQNNEKQLEKLVEKMMTEIHTETTSDEFTTKLMMRVHALSPEKSITYQPIISKTGWIFILLCMFTIMGIIIANANDTKSDWFNLDGMNHFLIKISQNFTLYQYSSISIYAVLLTTLMFFVQINVLIRKYQKSLGM